MCEPSFSIPLRLKSCGRTPPPSSQAAAFHVFRLPRPTAARPYIAGLLDPCTNSKLAPNIPAEALYDKRDDGLRLANSWAGKFVLLNPDYSAQVQWRFVNRAIDEVENDRVRCARCARCAVLRWCREQRRGG